MSTPSEAHANVKGRDSRFRENLSTYLEWKTPVAIARHGATIGIYLQPHPRASRLKMLVRIEPATPAPPAVACR